MSIRLLNASDIETASNLADKIYPPSLYEPLSSFESKFLSFPQGTFGYFEEAQMLGYVFSHPWIKADLVGLGSNLTLPQNPDCYYIHDLAVSSKKSGIGTQLAIAALDAGRKNGYREFRLVSVNHTEEFWSRFGFKIIEAVKYGDNCGSKMKMKLSSKWNGTSTKALVSHMKLNRNLALFKSWAGNPMNYNEYIDYRSC